MASLSQTSIAQLATLFGIGRAPTAPGTVASAVALLLAAAIQLLFGPFALLLATIIVTIGGTWVSGHYVRQAGNSDPKECVIDELAGQWLACAFASMSGRFSIASYILAFLLFRFFDITKLWPVSAAERAPGGFGVMLDDVVAGLMAGIIVAVLRYYIVAM